MSGLFITLEGADGSGKSTISRMLSSYLRDNGLKVTSTREPGGTDISEEIRKIILDDKNTEMKSTTEALLYAASRAQHIEEKIVPAMRSNRIVICDRFVISSLVYQGIARNLGVENIKKINDFATGGLSPDLVLFFDVDPERAMRRRGRRLKSDRIEKEKMDFHRSVYEGYKSIVNEYDGNIKVIDASKSKIEVFEQVKQIVDKLIKGSGKYEARNSNSSRRRYSQARR